MLLKFKLDKDGFTFTNPADLIAAESIDYIKCHFDITDVVWKETDAIIAVFKSATYNKHSEVLLDSYNNCYIDPEVYKRGGRIQVKLVGDKYLNDTVISSTTITSVLEFNINENIIVPLESPSKYSIAIAELEKAKSSVDEALTDLAYKLAHGELNGVGIERIVYNLDGTVTITLSDGTVFTSEYSMKGATGNSGVYYGPDEPTDPDIFVWINPDGEPTFDLLYEIIDTWMDAHPEATTTVQDGSITVDKFTEGAKKKVLNATRNALLSFITPSYGAEAFYPNEYALGISYDGVTYNQINGTEQCAGAFRGGGDAIITKVGDYYVCVVNSDLDNLQPDSLNKAIQYVVTKDFRTFSEVKYFTAYNIGTYLMNTYGVSESFASSKQWEPSLFFDNSGNLYLTISGGYKADESYPADCYYYGSASVFIRYFKQLYMPVVFDEETETLVAAEGGTIHEFKFPSGVESVIDAQVVPNGENYYYIYKDRVTCACNIATMDDLDDTPVNVVECLYGASFSENPYMVSFGDYKLIYVTHYLMDGTSRDGKVICAKNDLSKFEAMRYVVNGDIMADGSKCRSIHPIVMDDVSILNYFENECGVCIGGVMQSGSSNLNPQNLVDQLAIYYNLPQTLSSNVTYLVPANCTIIADTRWTHDFSPILFKRYNTANNVEVTLQLYGKLTTQKMVLSGRGYFGMFCPATEQEVLLATPPLSNQWTFERNEVKCEFWRSDNSEVLHYKITGNNTSTRAAGAVVELNANTGNIPSVLTFNAVLNATVGDVPMFIKIDVANGKLRFVYPNGSTNGDKYVGNGSLVTSVWS